MKSKILLVVSILFGLMFVNSGLNKFFNYMPIPDDLPQAMINMMSAFMELGWIFPLIAVVEIVGGIFFMIPRLRALGAIMLFPIIIGIVLTHLFQAPSGLLMALILLIINVWVILENREKYMPMIS